MRNFKSFVNDVKEEVPVNAISAGNIDGAGYGPKGEPGVKAPALKKYKRKNEKQANFMIALVKRMSKGYK